MNYYLNDIFLSFYHKEKNSFRSRYFIMKFLIRLQFHKQIDFLSQIPLLYYSPSLVSFALVTFVQCREYNQ